MVMRVTSVVLNALIGEARAAHPRECCGLLFGTQGEITAHRPATNVHPKPQTHFEIEPRALIDAHREMRNGGQRLVGYYHSHPLGRPEPSATDQALAAKDGMTWAIVCAEKHGGRVTLWRAGEEGLEPLPYRVLPA